MFLQIEFKNRQKCTRFAKNIKKSMGTFFDSKVETCVFLKFPNSVSRHAVKNILLKSASDFELRYRDSGVDYLYVK